MNYEDNSSAFGLTELPKESQLRNIKKTNNDEISDKSTNYQPLTIRKNVNLTDKELLSMPSSSYTILREEQLRLLSNLKK